ncbi:hypothetical protein KL930_002253 [Ogataea haglerorum]|uniref:Uncharacterized protein n=1 Tax=Ogataea haglerorum TaxID=1937702 RepID=A0AAN6I221_9ASCO|nr:uncharacterized protein KL911_000142 [Ogataea haglerorum]KAG7698959.1 hypothetical protein KL915_001251 [Ogataea haglerorum]KAG7700563.1 hypothetical protein KL951_000678 [Ogataea haglerorum]KAG7710001.1 hypothetical protein KL914_000911 [Ogataea haglerorum]KAG7711217.1 hypothetical protein KL950_001183 [Ogataea haglerorum]KAG7720515.1 hypothetical protein KL913_001415 [Ogataea haglerorum]
MSEPQEDKDYDRSIKDDVIYEIRETPEFNETRALIIANLRQPFDNQEFQDLLNEQAAKTNSTIERAWLNNRRSHCIVIVSDVAGAVAIQKNLNGTKFPKEDTNQEDGVSRHPLYIDFIPVKATEHWIDQENKGPKDAVWKVSYVRQPSKRQEGQEFLVATHKMLNYPNKTFGYKSSTRYRGRGAYRGRGRGGFRGYRDYDYRYAPYRRDYDYHDYPDRHTERERSLEWTN